VSIELVIFDCDGVLFESEAANLGFYNEVLSRAGEGSVPAHSEAACHALASADLFRRMFADRPGTLARVQAIAQEVDYGPFYPLMTPRAGLRELLAELGSRYRLAMATNRGRTALGVIDHFDLHAHFELTVGALDVARAKPFPDMLLRCADHFGVASGAAVYVGDQPGDAAAAEAAKMTFIAIGSEVPAAPHRIRDLRELPRLLESL
jgi:beta-phosphoglucomutase-like phosphatase (HAD superfamily)